MDKETQQYLDNFIEQALAEDVGGGDHTSMACIPPDAQSKAKLLVKDPGILAGIAVAEKNFFKRWTPRPKFERHMEGRSRDELRGCCLWR